MKKFFGILMIAGILSACETTPKTESTTQSGTTTTTTVYTPGDGDIIMRDGKTFKWSNGAWVANEGNTTMSNGMVITSDGVVTHETKTVTLQEGETVSRETGRFFDKAGNAVDDAWDATKRGVSKAAGATKDALKDAGNAISRGAKKVGNKTDSIVKDIKD